MESKSINLNDLETTFFDLRKTTSKTNLAEVFNNSNHSYLNELTLFTAHFNAIPNFIHEIHIDCKKANKWFVETYKSEIKDWYYSKGYFDQIGRAHV